MFEALKLDDIPLQQICSHIDKTIQYIYFGFECQRFTNIKEGMFLSAKKTIMIFSSSYTIGLLPEAYCGLRMRRECRDRFPRHCGLAIPPCITALCVTHVPWCMVGSLTNGFLWSLWCGNRFRYYRRMHNLQLCLSCKGLVCYIRLIVFMTEFWNFKVRNNQIGECIHKIKADIYVEPHRSDILKHISN